MAASSIKTQSIEELYQNRLFDSDRFKIDNFAEYCFQTELLDSLTSDAEIDQYAAWENLNELGVCAYSIRRILTNPNVLIEEINKNVRDYETKFDGDGTLRWIIEEFEKDASFYHVPGLRYKAFVASKEKDIVKQLAGYYKIVPIPPSYDALIKVYRTTFTNMKTIAKYFRSDMIGPIAAKILKNIQVYQMTRSISPLVRYNRLDIIKELLKESVIAEDFNYQAAKNTCKLWALNFACFFHNYDIIEHIGNMYEDVASIFENYIEVTTIDMKMAKYLKGKGVSDEYLMFSAIRSANIEVYQTFKPDVINNYQKLEQLTPSSGSVELLNLVSQDFDIDIDEFRPDPDQIVGNSCYEMLFYLLNNDVVFPEYFISPILLRRKFDIFAYLLSIDSIDFDEYENTIYLLDRRDLDILLNMDNIPDDVKERIEEVRNSDRFNFG